MKTTGVTRKVDELGRIVLPIEIRKNLGIETKDELEISIKGSAIILKKRGTSCVFCGSKKDVLSYREQPVCCNCIDELTALK